MVSLKWKYKDNLACQYACGALSETLQWLHAERKFNISCNEQFVVSLEFSRDCIELVPIQKLFDGLMIDHCGAIDYGL